MKNNNNNNNNFLKDIINNKFYNRYSNKDGYFINKHIFIFIGYYLFLFFLGYVTFVINYSIYLQLYLLNFIYLTF